MQGKWKMDDWYPWTCLATPVLDTGDSSRTSFLLKCYASTMMTTSKISDTLADLVLEYLIIQITVDWGGGREAKENIMDKHPN